MKDMEIFTKLDNLSQHISAIESTEGWTDGQTESLL